MTALATDPATFDSCDLRQLFSAFPSGLVAISARTAAGPTGLVASTFTPVSLEPALVSVCIGVGSTTWPQLHDAPRLGLSVLADHHGALARQLSGPPEQRFTQVPIWEAQHGALLIEGAVATMECSLAQEVLVGDHRVVILRLHAMQDSGSAQPLLFHRSEFARVSH